MFDARELATRLETKAGMPHGRAVETAAALRDALTTDYSTRQDMEMLRAAVKQDMAMLRADVKQELELFRAEINTRINDLEIRLYRTIGDAQTNMAKWFAGMMVVQIGVIVGLLKASG